MIIPKRHLFQKIKDNQLFNKFKKKQKNDFH